VKVASTYTISIKGQVSAQKATARLRAHLKRLRIRWSTQRGHILTVLLSRQYVSIRDIHAALKRRGQRVSPATIYQMMRVLCAVGLAQPKRQHFRAERVQSRELAKAQVDRDRLEQQGKKDGGK